MAQSLALQVDRDCSYVVAQRLTDTPIQVDHQSMLAFHSALNNGGTFGLKRLLRPVARKQRSEIRNRNQIVACHHGVTVLKNPAGLSGRGFWTLTVNRLAPALD